MILEYIQSLNQQILLERVDPLPEHRFASYIKLVCTSVLEGDYVSVAEFGVRDN